MGNPAFGICCCKKDHDDTARHVRFSFPAQGRITTAHSAYVWPLIEGPMYCYLDSSRPSRLFQVRLATIRARPICRGKIM